MHGRAKKINSNMHACKHWRLDAPVLPRSIGIGRVRVAPVQKVDKGKAPVLARLPIVGDIDPRHRPKGGEKFLIIGGRHRRDSDQIGS